MKLSVFDDLSHQHNRLVSLIATSLVSFGYLAYGNQVQHWYAWMDFLAQSMMMNVHVIHT
jgi:hypothetical protein